MTAPNPYADRTITVWALREGIIDATDDRELFTTFRLVTYDPVLKRNLEKALVRGVPLNMILTTEEGVPL